MWVCAVMVFEFWLCCFVFVSVDLSSCVLFYFPLPAFVFFHLMSVLRLPGLLCFWSAPCSCHAVVFVCICCLCPCVTLVCTSFSVLLLDFSRFVANLFHLPPLELSFCFVPVCLVVFQNSYITIK